MVELAFEQRWFHGGMDEGNEGKSSIRRMEKLTLETKRKIPADLLQRFMGGNPAETSMVSNEEESEDVELSLGLSLGGRFGVDKSKLVRSSSIAGSIPIVRDDEDAVAPSPPAKYPALVRTSSLPAETEEEWRKRKALQTLRRMEAKRRRSEKQRNIKEQGAAAAGSRLLAARQGIGSGGGAQPSRSVESQGGSSSGISESDSKPFQGSSSCGEVSPASIHSLQEICNQEASAGAKGKESPSKRPEGAEKRQFSSMEDMPCVFTQGEGPNGRRIEGILYKYGKGEEVRIICVCHGNSLSPAEFVRHAGGTDVTHPLRHIVVNPSATPFR
ncbi:hypothetical protein NMG60_11036174 [Bertholletia excelsa]